MLAGRFVTMSLLPVLVVLAAAQRGGGAGSGNGPIPRAVTSGRLQVVTTSWLRMNDPEAIRGLAADRRPGVVSPLQPFELALAGRGGGLGSPIGAGPSKRNYGELIRGMRPPVLANVVGFGETIANGKPLATYYESIALQDGKIVAPQLAAPFRTTRVTTYLGLLPSGKLKEDGSVSAQGTSELSIPVKAGQAYRVDFTFDPKGLAEKAYSVLGKVDDGNANNLNLVAKVVPPKGKLEITKEAGDVIATPLRKVTINLLIRAKGNTPGTKIEIVPNHGELSNLGLYYDGPKSPVTLKNDAVTSVPVTLDVGAMYDRSGSVNLTVKGYDGASTTTFTFPISIVNQWLDTGLMVFTRDIRLAGGAGIVPRTTFRRFQMTTSGTWNYRSDGGIQGDTFVFRLEKKIGGRQYGVVDPRHTFTGTTIGQSNDLGKSFELLKNGGFNLIEGTFPGDGPNVTAKNFYDALVQTHATYKAQGLTDLAEADYQKALAEYKKKL